MKVTKKVDRCGSEMNKESPRCREKGVHIERRGQGPLLFWRMMGAVRSKNSITLVLYTISSSEGGGGGVAEVDGGNVEEESIWKCL